MNELRKYIGTFFLILLTLAAIAGPLIIVKTQWENITTDGSYYVFYYIEMEYRYIALIVILSLLPFGIYNLIFIIKGLSKILKNKDFEVKKSMKICSIIVIISGLGIAYDYFPALPYDLGWIKPNYRPYLQYGGDGSILISWDTADLRLTELNYGLDKQNLNQSITGGKFFNSGNNPSFHHCIRIPELNTGTKYFYKIASISNQIYSFSTAPSIDSNESVVFTIVGDTQYNYLIKKTNIQRMKQDPDGFNFTVVAGDVIHWDNGYEEWNDLFRQDTYGGIAYEKPLMVASGNHETYCAVLSSNCEYREQFKLRFQNIYPHNDQIQPGAEDIGYYFSYNYSNIHMITLDNFEMENSQSFSDAQINWLKEDLSRNQNMWKFIYFHIPVYSIMDTHPNMNYIQTLETIFYEFNVDAVFYAHQHDFEAFQVNKTESDSGIFHFLIGGGGGTLENFYLDKYMDLKWPSSHITNDNLSSKFDEIYARNYFLMGDSHHHYMKVKINGEQAKYTTIRTSDGSIIGEFTAKR